jgi:hypothetical protein
MATYLTSNTGNVKSTDRTAGGSKPDSTPATGTTNTTITGAVSSVTGSLGVGASPTTGNVSVYLNPTGVTAATYGDATHVPQIAVNAQGQITSASNVTITGSSGVTSVSGTGTVNGITLSGTVTSTGNLTLGGTLSGVTPSQLTAGTVGQRLITNNSSSVVWSNDPIIYAKDYGYGATGNTVTQNTTALQNAVNAAMTANGYLLLPAGSIHINSAITIGSSGTPFAGRIKIGGCGKHVTEIVQDSATDGFDVYLANPYTNDVGLEIADLSLIGNNAATATAIYINMTRYGSIEDRDLISINNVTMTGIVTSTTLGWTNGLWVIAAWHLNVTNCYAGGCIGTLPTSSGLGSGAGFLLQDCINVKLLNITAEYWNRGVSIPNVYTTAWVSGHTYTAGQYLNYGGLFYLCILNITSSITPPNVDTTHFYGTVGPSQGVQINNYMALDTINALYVDTTCVYLTNFLFDNGNNFYSSWQTIELHNLYASSYITGGQILQAGGDYQIYLNNCANVMITNVGLNAQNPVNVASIYCTNGTSNTVVTGCIFGSAVGVKCDSGTTNNKATANIVPNGNLDNNSADASTNQLGDVTGITTIPTLTGAATYSWSINIGGSGQANACLGRLPRSVLVQRAKTDSTVTYKQMLAQWDYNNSGNTATTVYLVAYMSDGSNLPSAAERFMVTILP